MTKQMRLFIAIEAIFLAMLVANEQYIPAAAVLVLVIVFLLSWRRDERLFRELQRSKKELDVELDKMRRFNMELENELAAIRKYGNGSVIVE